MAVTKGQGNPNWTKEETALALELYFSLGQRMPSPNDKEVIALSSYLRSMGIYKNIAETSSSFRNPDGIVFKIGNLRAFDTGKGLHNTSKIDKLVWEEFGNNIQHLKSFCALIRSGVDALTSNEEIEYNDEDNIEFNEGMVLTKVHKTRERNRSLRKKLIKKLQNNGICRCEMCGIKPNLKLNELSLKMFECHHIIPVSESLRSKTKLKDLSLLCANCHRLIHALISQEKRWLKIDEAAKILSIKQSFKI